MTTYDSGQFTITCHKCLNEDDFDCLDWHDGWDQAKSVGWVAREVDGEWMNFCSNVCYFYFQKDQKRLLETERARNEEFEIRKKEIADQEEQKLIDLLPF